MLTLKKYLNILSDTEKADLVPNRPRKSNPESLRRLKFFIPIICILIIFNLFLGQEPADKKQIKVLIYNGSETEPNSVKGVIYCLEQANTMNTTPNIEFIYNTSDVINRNILAPYDVLVMPGGTGGSYYLNSENINGKDIQEFVAQGKGYVGICAGAYSGAAYTKDWYYGWGVAPHVCLEHPWVEGNLSVEITSKGRTLFGYDGNHTMSHYNGPAMYSLENSSEEAIIFATYSDNSTGTQGYGAIVGDYYGDGRSVLSGVHPEFAPQYPDILSKMVIWAADINNTTSSY